MAPTSTASVLALYVIQYSSPLALTKSENDLAGTIRVCNKDKGNSCNDTQAFAVLEGPVAENYDNEKLTFFNPAYPTGEYLQRLMDDSLQALIFTVGQSSPDGLPLDCAVAIFLPIPMLDPCTERHFKVEFSPLAVNEQLVEYDSHQRMTGLPPEITIPDGQDTITVALVHAEDDANVINGYQIIVDKVVISTQKLYTPFELRGRSPSDVEVACRQLSGMFANDLKQVLILSGQCSNSCLCPCHHERTDPPLHLRRCQERSMHLHRRHHAAAATSCSSPAAPASCSSETSCCSVERSWTGS